MAVLVAVIEVVGLSVDAVILVVVVDAVVAPTAVIKLDSEAAIALSVGPAAGSSRSSRLTRAGM